MINKYVKIHVRQLDCVLVNFYTVESLSEAKERLLRDVEAIKLPHLPGRSDGEGFITRELDNMITRLRFGYRQNLWMKQKTGV